MCPTPLLTFYKSTLIPTRLMGVIAPIGVYLFQFPVPRVHHVTSTCDQTNSPNEYTFTKFTPYLIQIRSNIPVSISFINYTRHYIFIEARTNAKTNEKMSLLLYFLILNTDLHVMYKVMSTIMWWQCYLWYLWLYSNRSLMNNKSPGSFMIPHWT